MVSLDTHVLVHALAGTLLPRERAVLQTQPWGISAIVTWELCKLAQLGRVHIDSDDPEVASALSRLHVWPLGLEVARVSTRLDFRGDPADELIAATSIVHRVPLLTRDRQIRRSRLVPLV